MTRPVSFFCLALVLIGAAALGVQRGPSRTGLRPGAPLGALPPTMGDWGEVNDPPSPLLADARASGQRSMTYRSGSDVVWVSVGVYLDQGEGRRPAARELLFPGHGWTTLSEQSVKIPVDGGAGALIPATLVVQTTADRRIAIVYWYQIGPRSVASDHWYRAVGLYDRVISGRADGALVRLGSPISVTADPATAVAGQARFMRAFYPWLLKSLAPPAHSGGGQS